MLYQWERTWRIPSRTKAPLTIPKVHFALKTALPVLEITEISSLDGMSVYAKDYDPRLIYRILNSFETHLQSSGLKGPLSR